MAKTFTVEIVTPERVAYSETAESLVVPAERGYLGVLAGHAPLLCALQPGEITLRREGRETHFATSGGFMEVTPARAVLLTESVEAVDTIDADRAGRARDRAKERLASGDASVDAERARASHDRALNRLRLASKYRK